MGGIDKVHTACRELLLLQVVPERQKYNVYLEESKKKAEAEQSDKKMKAVSDQIENSKRKKRGCIKISAHLRHLQIHCLQRQKLKTCHKICN